MTPSLLAFLRDIDRRDPSRTGVPVDPSNNRATAVRLGYVVGRPMKVGHRKVYQLTKLGREAIV